MGASLDNELNLEGCVRHLRIVLRCFDGPLRQNHPEMSEKLDLAAANLQQVIDLIDQSETP